MERKSEGEFRKLPSHPKFWLKSFSTRASQTHPSSRHAQITKWAGLIVPPPLSPLSFPPSYYFRRGTGNPAKAEVHGAPGITQQRKRRRWGQRDRGELRRMGWRTPREGPLRLFELGGESAEFPRGRSHRVDGWVDDVWTQDFSETRDYYSARPQRD